MAEDIDLQTGIILWPPKSGSPSGQMEVGRREGSPPAKIATAAMAINSQPL